MPAGRVTIYRDTGKPNEAVPVKSECASPGAFILGEPNRAPLSNSQENYARECWPWDAPWCRRFNLETWDNAGDWDSTGVF